MQVAVEAAEESRLRLEMPAARPVAVAAAPVLPAAYAAAASPALRDSIRSAPLATLACSRRALLSI